MSSKIDNVSHYDGTRCMELIESMGVGAEFCVANSIKYLWRLGRKASVREDLGKARWYLERARSKGDASNHYIALLTLKLLDLVEVIEHEGPPQDLTGVITDLVEGV